MTEPDPNPGDMVTAVRNALASKRLNPVDQAAAALALKYAIILDEADELSDLADMIKPVDMDMADRLRKLRVKIDGNQAYIDVGPKLLQTLTALGLTPAGRSENGKGASGGERDPAARALAQLQAEAGPPPGIGHTPDPDTAA